MPELVSRNRMLQQRAERMAINTPIQGTAADLIKIAMIKADKALEKSLPKAKMLLQVHDELVLEVPKGDAKKAEKIVRDAMCNALSLSVPIEVDCGVGKNWAQAH